MKRILIELLALLLFASAACAESVWPEGITEENGRLTGTVQVKSGSSEHFTCKLDCPVPPETIPSDLFEVGFRFFSKKDMQNALKAAGQSTKGKFSNNRDGTLYTGDWNAESSADISREDAEKQAVDIALSYLDALGVEVVRTPNSISRPYDVEALTDIQQAFYTHSFSDPEYFMRKLPARYQRMKKYWPKQSAYTSVDFTVCLEGIPIPPWPSYPAGFSDEPDARIAYEVGASVTVSDSGIIVKASTHCIPELKERRPRPDTPDFLEREKSFFNGYPLTARDSAHDVMKKLREEGREAGLYAQEDDHPFLPDENIMSYGYQTVITDIHPILHPTDSETEWACFWQIDSAQEYKDGWRTDW